MKKYELLLFDADGTLFDFDAAMRKSIKNCVESVGKECTEKMLNFFAEINNIMWQKLESGKIDRKTMQKERFEMFLKKYPMNIEPTSFDELYLKNLANCPFLFSGVKELCFELSKFYKMAIITNGIAPMQRIRLENSEIAPCFSKIFISHEMGVSKPQKEYFTAVLNEYPEIERQKVLVIGDTLSVDIKGGNDSLIDTCFVNRFKNSANEIHPTYTVENINELKNLLLNGGKNAEL